MGCCSSLAAEVPSVQLTKKNTPAKTNEDQNDAVQPPENIKLHVDIPQPYGEGKELLLATAENSIGSCSTSTPTNLSDPSSRKSVTFNPVSTVKEYYRDASTADTDFVTYLCSQLGYDTLSDADSTDGFDQNDFVEQEDAPHNNSPRDDDPYEEEWARYEAELLRESEIDPSDPRYIDNFDIEYDPDCSFQPVRSPRASAIRAW